MSNEKENVLKILPEYFEEVADGFKRAEVRYNDRDFKVGDIYTLREWDGEKFTGRDETIRITHVLHGAGFKGLLRTTVCFLCYEEGGRRTSCPDGKTCDSQQGAGSKQGGAFSCER